jgi:hypothetical protein
MTEVTIYFPIHWSSLMAMRYMVEHAMTVWRFAMDDEGRWVAITLSK